MVKRKCKVCGKEHPLISSYLGVCKDCLKDGKEEAINLARVAHQKSKECFGLPKQPPKSKDGIACKICGAECIIGENRRGYCGLRWNKNGKLVSLVNDKQALLHYYLDAHVTNCCNAWFCPAGTGDGYPRFAHKEHAEIGYYNLALFLYACNFDCMYCQNWSHKNLKEGNIVSIDELVNYTLENKRISCWCWFGGSPEPQLPFTINAGKRLVEEKGERIMRICYEWNGYGNPKLVERAGELSYITGGNVKFDLKAFNENIHIALTSLSNKRTLKNFELLFNKFYERRKELPFLGATTLLVPYYVDEEEVEGIAKFISSLDENIPYSLLVFHPDYMMRDLPITSKEQVMRCYYAAKKHLKRVYIGNIGLLGMSESIKDYKIL
jgi:pyruvate formate lyase activating enzyme